MRGSYSLKLELMTSTGLRATPSTRPLAGVFQVLGHRPFSLSFTPLCFPPKSESLLIERSPLRKFLNLKRSLHLPPFGRVRRYNSLLGRLGDHGGYQHLDDPSSSFVTVEYIPRTPWVE
ncbi:hypothetical protein HAX54_050531, partial [Datura stramonium]|nr:hypothetical protein [Datura stramonium]